MNTFKWSAAIAGLCVALCAVPLGAQDTCGCADNPKAEKAYAEATAWAAKGDASAALSDYKKASKLTEGKCTGCRARILKYALELDDWKSAEEAGQEIIASADTNTAKARAHEQMALIYVQESVKRKKPEMDGQVHDELARALAAYANFPDAIYMDGEALARLGRNDAAKAQFAKFVQVAPANDVRLDRAKRFAENPELAKARLAPPFKATTMDGKTVSIDDFQGKVVLLDFWAVWCGPCREALPHMKKIAAKFQGEPFVMLSVSLDDDEDKWKEFVATNGMTWLQTRAGGWDGALPKEFNVKAIPHTFTIDCNGVLQDEEIGDGNIDGRLKKLIEQAKKAQAAKNTVASGS
jgi:thiol-disulfide isomerase/thioredoxin